MAFNNTQKRENVNRTIMRFFNDGQENITSLSIKAWNNYITFGIRPILEKEGDRTLYDSQNEISFLCNQQSLYSLYYGLKLLKKGKTKSIAIEDLDGKLLRIYTTDGSSYTLAIVNADKKFKNIIEQIEFDFMCRDVVDNTNTLYVDIFDNEKDKIKTIRTCSDFNCFFNFIKYINDNGISFGVQNVALSTHFQFVSIRNGIEVIKKYFEKEMVGGSSNFQSESRFQSNRFNNSRGVSRFSKGGNSGFSKGKSSKEFSKAPKEVSEEDLSGMLDDEE